MPAERPLPAARPAHRSTLIPRSLIAPAIALALAGVSCRGSAAPPVLLSEHAPDSSRVALVRLAPCGQGWCESLWIGTNAENATRLVALPSGEEHCNEIAWTRDGTRVAFLINGYQLRLYDAHTHAPAGLVDLVAPDARPTTRVARGITFSDNGAAVTFDDCPRDRSGCRPGMLAIR